MATKSNNYKISKISKPILPEVIARDRLYRICDNQPYHTITWVAGAAGSGKSTLIADYLQNKNKPYIWYRLDEGDNDLSTFFHYLSKALKAANSKTKNIPIPFLTTEHQERVIDFSRRFFSYMAQSLPDGAIVVFDNYNERSAFDAAFHAAFKEGLLCLFPSVRVMLISREAPQNGFAPLHRDGRLSVIGKADLAFTAEETRGFLLKETGEDLSKEITRQIFETTKGWVAGLRLILTGVRHNQTLPASFGEITLDNVFDYFDSELFQTLDRETGRLMVRTALLPRTTLDMAVTITQNPGIGRLLYQLAENHFFIEKYGDKDAVYQFHPMFHDFLQMRAVEIFSQAEIQAFQSQAAFEFEKRGWIDEALHLFLQAGRHEDCARLLLKNAGTMVRQLRYQTLRKWLLLLPEPLRASNPWLNYWTGVSYRFNSLAESRRYYLAAFDQFNSTDDLNGALLAWSGIVDTITYEFNRLTDLDPYLDWFQSQKNRKKSFRFESQETEARVAGSVLCAFFCRQPQKIDLKFWRQRTLAAAAACDDITLKISSHIWSIIPFVFTVPDKKTLALRDQMIRFTKDHESRLVRLANLWARAYSFFIATVAPQDAIEIAKKGLRLAQEIQVHLYDGSFNVTGVIASLTMRDFQGADRFLRELRRSLKPENLYFTALYHYLKGQYHFNRGDYAAAEREGETATGSFRETGHVLLELMADLHRLQAAFMAKTDGRTLAPIEEIIARASKLKSPLIAYEGRLTKAFMLLTLGRRPEGLKNLQNALRQGRKQGWLRLTWSWPGMMIGTLCATAREHGLEPGFAGRIMRSYGLQEEMTAATRPKSDRSIQIRTLGRLEIEREGKRLLPAGKSGAKPWRLLQLLLASGRKPMAIDKLQDFLWPEKDGDLAHAAFKTTINRLRNLLGVKESIHIHDHKVAINRELCAVDLDAFEETLARALLAGDGPDRGAGLQEAIARYQGPFLDGEPQPSWARVKREEVKEKYISALLALATWHEKNNRPAQAIACYQQGLRFEPGEEALRQRLNDFQAL